MFSTKEPVLKIFDEIELEDHEARVSFYEAHTEHIFALDESKQQYFNFHYVCSLYELGRHEHVITEIDPLIEFVFLNKTDFFPPQSFENLLFKKVYTFYHLVRYDDAVLLMEQLIGLYPENVAYQNFMKRLYRARLNFHSENIRLAALVLIFLSSIISAILWFATMKQDDKTFIFSFSVIISPCILALGLLVGAHILNYVKAIKMTAQLVYIKKKKHIMSK